MVSACTGAVHSFAGLAVCRVVLGEPLYAVSKSTYLISQVSLRPLSSLALSSFFLSSTRKSKWLSERLSSTPDRKSETLLVVSSLWQSWSLTVLTVLRDGDGCSS